MTARTVVDVILGEAKAGDYQDMLAIASVIANRAMATGATVEEVIAAAGQFDAYGKSLPKGVSQYREEAARALQDVLENGPTTTATFYATPTAAKNLPKGLSLTGETQGHQYFEDPEGRAIQVGDRSVVPDQGAIMSAYGPLDDDAGAANEAFAGLLGPADPSTATPSLSDYAMAKPVGYEMPGLAGDTQAMLDGLVNSGLVDPSEITSGYRDEDANKAAGGASHSQHLGGNAFDLSRSIPQERRDQILETARGLGARGIGVYPSGKMHLDTGVGPTRPAAWGPGGYSGSAPSTFPEYAQDDIQALLSGGLPPLAAGPLLDMAGIPSPTPDPTGLLDTVSFSPDQPVEAGVDGPTSAFSEPSLNDFLAALETNQRLGLVADPLPDPSPVVSPTATAGASASPPPAPAASALGPEARIDEAFSLFDAPIPEPVVPQAAPAFGTPVEVGAPPPVAEVAMASHGGGQDNSIENIGGAYDVFSGKSNIGRASNGDIIQRDPTTGQLTRQSQQFGYTENIDESGNFHGFANAPEGSPAAKFQAGVHGMLPGPETASRFGGAAVGGLLAGPPGALAGGIGGGLLHDAFTGKADFKTTVGEIGGTIAGGTILGPPGAAIGAAIGRRLASGKGLLGDGKDDEGFQPGGLLGAVMSAFTGLQSQMNPQTGYTGYDPMAGGNSEGGSYDSVARYSDTGVPMPPDRPGGYGGYNSQGGYDPSDRT